MPTREELKALGFDSVPNSIVLLGLGPSHQSYVGEVLVNLGQPWADEVWTINGGSVAFDSDRCFSIADLPTNINNIPHWHKWLTSRAVKRNIPVYTSKAYPEYPTSITYPLEPVRQFIGFDLVFCNGGPMALAMAMWMGVKEIWLFGIDYTYPNVHLAEQGGQAFSFLLGMCKQMGIKFHIPHTSSLMGAVYNLKAEDGKMSMKPYGYKDYNMSVGAAPAPYPQPLAADGAGDVRPHGTPLGAEEKQAGPDGGNPGQVLPVQVRSRGKAAAKVLPP